jgi:hypothetical protein
MFANFVNSIMVQIIVFFTNLGFEKEMVMPAQERAQLAQILLIVLISAMVWFTVSVKPRWNAQKYERRNAKLSRTQEINPRMTASCYYFHKQVPLETEPVKEPEPIKWVPVEDVIIGKSLPHNTKVGIEIQKKPRYEPRELEMQILDLLTLGNKDLRDDIIRLLTRLSTVEDTSEFLSDNPNVLNLYSQTNLI